MTKPKQKIDTTAALRHVVFADLISLLPVASVAQAERFAANLALCREVFNSTEYASREREIGIHKLMLKLLNLRVSPDVATTNYRGASKNEIERILSERYGDRLDQIAGFYFKKRWRVNLPENCALHGYKNRLGFYTGILCQPLDRLDMFFLLTSAKFGGERAIRLEEAQRDFFEQFNEPVISTARQQPDYHAAITSGAAQ
jgi:hypothetical protein